MSEMKTGKLLFRIIPPCHQDASWLQTASVHFLLEEAPVEEDHSEVSYYLHATPRLTGRSTEYIGVVSIVRLGQKQGEKRLLRKFFPQKVFTQLPASFVSISFSVELFMALAKHLADSEMTFIDALHLITDQESPYYRMAKSDAFFKKAALRGGSMDSDVFSIARHYLFGERLVNLMEQNLSIRLKGFEPFEFGFQPSPVPDEDFPNRIVAFIGKNGTGKSTAIYKIAKILYASREDRRMMAGPVGEVLPGNSAFTRLLVVSYSAFDNFFFPGFGREGYRQLLSPEGQMRFRYLGVRDIAKESDVSGPGSDLNSYSDRTSRCVLKPVSVLAQEVAAYGQSIQGEKKRADLLDRIRKDLESFHPLLAEDVDRVLQDSSTGFFNTSTGHKFFIHAIMGILASIEQGSLLLFDEPENHMHPPMISTTIKYVRWILNDSGSYMFVSTHSPVVIQELFARNVYVVRRSGDECTVVHPRQETYGESLGLINSEVFDLTTDVTSFHQVFDRLYEVWGCAQMKKADQVIDKFEKELKTHLSNQMVAYLIGKKYVEA